MKNFQLSIVLFFSVFGVFSQKKILEHKDKALWNRIRNTQISNSGDYMMYTIGKEEKDQTLQLKTIKGKPTFSYPRVKTAQFSYDSNNVIFNVNAFKDSITAMKRKKLK